MVLAEKTYLVVLPKWTEEFQLCCGHVSNCAWEELWWGANCSHSVALYSPGLPSLPFPILILLLILNRWRTRCTGETSSLGPSLPACWQNRGKKEISIQAELCLCRHIPPTPSPASQLDCRRCSVLAPVTGLCSFPVAEHHWAKRSLQLSQSITQWLSEGNVYWLSVWICECTWVDVGAHTVHCPCKSASKLEFTASLDGKVWWCRARTIFHTSLWGQ